jgi:hypothetical protein
MSTTEAISYGSGEVARKREWLHKRLKAMSRAGELPTTVSSLYYEGAQKGRWPSDDEAKKAGRTRTPRQDVSDAAQWLIEHDHVDPSWVVDGSRSMSDYSGKPDLRAATYSYARTVYLCPWRTNELAVPLVICESRSLDAALSPTVGEFRGVIVPTAGMSGSSYLRVATKRHLRFDTPVAYLGDGNPAGTSIEASVRTKLSQYQPRWEGSWTALAVTSSDMRRYRRFLKTKTDTRFRPHRTFQSLEAEALGTTELRRRLSEWFWGMLPEGFTWEAHRAEAERLRAPLLDALLPPDEDDEDDEDWTDDLG